MVGLTTAALLLSASAIALGTPLRNSESFAAFKREMTPKVGRKITVVGTLRSAKLGWLVEFKGWGVYIYATKDSDSPRQDALGRFNEHTVRVTGTLRYHPGAPLSQPEAATIPGHFFFDVAQARVTSLSPPRPKRSKE